MAVREFISGALDSAPERNDSGNAPVLMMLDRFKFGITTAAFQEVQRSTSYRWPAQERVGQLDALQFTGPGEDRVTLPGVIYPDFNGGTGQVETLRRIAAQGKPVRLISAGGAMLGLWVIENVDDTASSFKPDGSPRRIDFSVSIRKFANADL